MARSARSFIPVVSASISAAFGSRRAANGRTAANGRAGTANGRTTTNGQPAANGQTAAAAGNRPSEAAGSPARSEWWVQDRAQRLKLRAGRRYRLIGAVAAVIVLVAAGAVAFAVSQSPTATGPNDTALSAAQLRAEATARTAAAIWVVAQVSHTAIVACDPVMCRTLRAHHFPSGELLQLGPAAPDPVNSAVVVATPAVRSQFGSSLAAAYAPAVLASFGNGIARVDVRVIAPQGAATYLAELKADVAFRKQSAPLLLRSNRFVVLAPAVKKLKDGQVDIRLLIATADISPSSPMTIVDFGGSARGASPGIPLRYVDLTETHGATLTRSSPFVRSVLGQLSTLQSPYRPSVVQLVPAAGGQDFLRIEFAAPSPLGVTNQR